MSAQKEAIRRRQKANPAKVSVVMSEYKQGDLKSGSGKPVTDPKQAIAIALSEARKKHG